MFFFVIQATAQQALCCNWLPSLFPECLAVHGVGMHQTWMAPISVPQHCSWEPIPPHAWGLDYHSTPDWTHQRPDCLRQLFSDVYFWSSGGCCSPDWLVSPGSDNHTGVDYVMCLIMYTSHRRQHWESPGVGQRVCVKHAT